MQVVQSIHLPFAATSIAINEEKQCIAVSNAFAGELRVINFETQELIKTFEFEDNLYNGVNNILWKGSRIVAVTGAETEIRVWNDEGSETVISLTPCSVEGILLSEDGNILTVLCDTPSLHYMKQNGLDIFENIFQFHLPSLKGKSNATLNDAAQKADLPFEIQAGLYLNKNLLILGNTKHEPYPFGLYEFNFNQSENETNCFLQITSSPSDTSKLTRIKDQLFSIGEIEDVFRLFAINLEKNNVSEITVPQGYGLQTICEYHDQLFMTLFKDEQWFLMNQSTGDIYKLGGISTEGIGASANYLATGVDESVLFWSEA